MKATDIMHPEDAKAIQMIKSVPGYEKLVRLFMKLGYPKIRNYHPIHD